MRLSVSATLFTCSIALTLLGCTRVRWVVPDSPKMTRELYREHQAAESGCWVRGKRSVECPSVRGSRRGRVRFLRGVRSAEDVKVLRSGRVCGALPRGGVRCVGRDLHRSIAVAGLSSERAFLWDDGYCVQERNKRRVRCEWFSPDGEWDRRILFLPIRGPLRFEEAPGGVCVCTAPDPTERPSGIVMSACLRTDRPVLRTTGSDLDETFVGGNSLDVVQFISNWRRSTGICEELAEDPSALESIMRRAETAPELQRDPKSENHED